MEPFPGELATNEGILNHIVCDWYHNAPQLFYLYRPYDATLPSSCSKVTLAVEHIS